MKPDPIVVFGQVMGWSAFAVVAALPASALLIAALARRESRGKER